MKKKYLYFFIVLAIIIVSIIIYLFFNNSKENSYQAILCNKKDEYRELNFQAETNVNISYKDDIVDLITVEKKITSSDKNILKSFLDSEVENIKINQNKFSGLKYSVKEKNDHITIIEKFDFKLIDINEYLKIYPEFKNSVVEDKLRSRGTQMYYQDLKFRCEQKK